MKQAAREALSRLRSGDYLIIDVVCGKDRWEGVFHTKTREGMRSEKFPLQDVGFAFTYTGLGSVAELGERIFHFMHGPELEQCLPPNHRTVRLSVGGRTPNLDEDGAPSVVVATGVYGILRNGQVMLVLEDTVYEAGEPTLFDDEDDDDAIA